MITTGTTSGLLLTVVLAFAAAALRIPAVRAWADGLWREPFEVHP